MVPWIAALVLRPSVLPRSLFLKHLERSASDTEVQQKIETAKARARANLRGMESVKDMVIFMVMGMVKVFLKIRIRRKEATGKFPVKVQEKTKSQSKKKSQVEVLEKHAIVQRIARNDVLLISLFVSWRVVLQTRVSTNSPSAFQRTTRPPDGGLRFDLRLEVWIGMHWTCGTGTQASPKNIRRSRFQCVS